MRHWNSQAAVIWMFRSKCAQSGCEKLGTEADIVTTSSSKTMNSNLNHEAPFSIHIMRHWNSQAAVIWMSQSKCTQSGCEKWGIEADIVTTSSSK
eukprot:scaffold207633_cov43-Cyclotella_meneghiniana.AAC.1